jgi:hypothetical protein
MLKVPNPTKENVASTRPYRQRLSDRIPRTTATATANGCTETAGKYRRRPFPRPTAKGGLSATMHSVPDIPQTFTVLATTRSTTWKLTDLMFPIGCFL